MHSTSTPLRDSQPAARQPSKMPHDVLAEAERQWIFTEDELLQSPSILDGMTPEDERELRGKGVHFITSTGMMLKLPQTTLSTAAIFFHRFLMRYSLLKGDMGKKLHHYQIASVALFLATKVEEHVRKPRELIIACCRVAQKNPNLEVHDGMRDYWRWRDTIIYHEDLLLELLCFDLTIESPYHVLYQMLKRLSIQHNKSLRDAAWSFINDGLLTQICLLFPPRTIAAAAIYAAAKQSGTEFPDDERGRPWWEVVRARLQDVRRACNYMADFYENPKLKPGNESIYVGLRTPDDGDDAFAKTRLKRSQTPQTPSAAGGVSMERRSSAGSANGSQGMKRQREEDPANGAAAASANGHAQKPMSRVPVEAQRQRSLEEPERKRARTASSSTVNDIAPSQPNFTNGAKDDEGSEEGEVEE